MSGKGSRYERSMPGMVGSMVVVIGLILVFVVIRAFNRDDLDVEREAIDYLPNVEGIQASGEFPVVYPPKLPEDWKAVDLSYDLSTLWSLSMFTAEDHYIGLFQGTDSVDDMVEEYVDEDAEEGKPVKVDSKLSGQWRTFSDEGGDRALVVEHDDTVVLLVSAGDKQDLKEMAASLSDAPLR